MIDHAQSKTQSALGPVFWLAWLAAIATLVAVFMGALWFAQKRLEGAPGTIAEAAATIAFVIGMIAVSMFPARENQRRGRAKPIRPAMARHHRRVAIAMIAYVAVLMGAIAVWTDAQASGALGWAVALAPVAPLLLFIRADLLYLKEEDDEFLKHRTREVYIWATGLTLGVCAAWGFLETFGLVPHAPVWSVFPVWGLCQIPAQAIASWKYR